MEEMLFDLLICLKIETNEELDVITNVLNVKPTDIILKGVSRSVVLNSSEKNIWMYDEKHRDCSAIGTLLKNFLEKIPNIFDKVEELKKHGRVSIRVSVVSDFAQIGFTLSEEDVQYLKCLNIPVEISVFSWGGCVDE